MCEAKLIQGNLFKKLIDCIKPLVVEANLTLSEDGLSLKCKDPQSVALVEMIMTTKAFEIFNNNFGASGQLKLGISMEGLQKFLKCSGDHDWITLRSEIGGDTMEMDFERPGALIRRFFSLNLVRIEMEELPNPMGIYPYEVTMSAREFERIIKDLSVIGESVTMRVDSECISFRAQGVLGKGNIVCHSQEDDHTTDLGKDGVRIRTTTPETVCELSFGLKYLSTFCKASSVSDTVRLGFPTLESHDVLIVEYALPDQAGCLRWFLASRTVDT